MEIVMALGLALSTWSIGVIFGAWAERCSWKSQLIARNLAHYDPKTGKWTWNEGLPVNPEQKEG